MGEPQRKTQSFQESRTRASEVDAEWLVVQLADEAEYWKARAEATARVLNVVIDEADARGQSAHIARAVDSALLAEVLSEDPDSVERSRAFRRAVGFGLLFSLTAWAMLGVLAFVLFQHFS
jgi:hypothetical protein